MDKKEKQLLFCIMIAVVLICAILTIKNGSAITKTKDKESIDSIVSSGIEAIETIDLDNSKAIDLDSLASTLNITEGGQYLLSGSLNGQISIDTDDEVILLLNNVDVTNTNGPAIEVTDAKYTLIYSLEGTTNSFTSGQEKDITDTSADSSYAAIHSKDDLYIAGYGILNVNGYINNAIASTDSMVIYSSTINVKSVNNGIKARDYLVIEDGNITIEASSDAIKTDSEEGLGDIHLEGGTILITSYGDAVSSSNDLYVDGIDIEITTGTGAIESNSTGFGGMGQWPGQWSNTGSTKTDETSQKGLKASGDIIIDSGQIQIDANDDGIHSDKNVTINGGNMTISSSDDGIHAEVSLIINGGDINVTMSYEGLEAETIEISGGDIRIKSSDDGMNATGSDPILTILGGNIYVNAAGDGLDSNMDIEIKGGYTIVDGPSDSANGALDSGSENGGTLKAYSGTLLAIGSSGMAESFDQSSEQCYFSIQVSGSQGSEIKIYDTNGNILIEHTSSKSFQSIVFTSSDMVENGTYIVSVDGVEMTITLDGNNYGTSNTMPGGWGNGGAPGGWGNGGKPGGGGNGGGQRP